MEQLVSIITPVYNSADYILDTIHSVLNQTYNNWEMILIDDCSTDNSRTIISDMMKTDNRLRLSKLEKNSGPAVARNNAIELSKGKFLAFLDSDDSWLPQKLERQISFMTEKNISFSFTSYEYLESGGYSKIITVPEKVNYNELLKKNVIGCLTAVIDRSKIGRVTFPDISSRQDYAFWLKVLKEVDYAYGLNEVLAVYNKRQQSISSKRFSTLRNQWKIFRKHEGVPLLKSLSIIVGYYFNGIKFRLGKLMRR